jgi:hydrogenase maturation protease
VHPVRAWPGPAHAPFRHPVSAALSHRLVICVGNAWRSDDAAGLRVARELRGTLPDGVELIEHEGEPTALVDAWDGADAVWLVDAVSSGAPPGTVHRLDASAEPLPAALFRVSSHLVGLGEAVELARALGRLPAHVVLFGIEGDRFEAGDRLSPEVEAAVLRIAELVRDEVAGSAVQPAQ